MRSKLGQSYEGSKSLVPVPCVVPATRTEFTPPFLFLYHNQEQKERGKALDIFQCVLRVLKARTRARSSF